MLALLIDDDIRLGQMLVTWMRAQGVSLEHRLDARSGLAQIRAAPPEVVILDGMLPDQDGLDVLRALRAEGSAVAVIMLTARGDELDRIVGLELGADDYVPKPFNPRELLARMRAVRRRGTPVASALKFGDLEIDRDRREVRVAGETRPLTGHQFAILRVLAESRGKVLTREQIMERVRGEDLDAFDRSIDVHISRIRAAIEPDPRTPTFILTLRGSGYLFTGEGR